MKGLTFALKAYYRLTELSLGLILAYALKDIIS